MPDGNGSAPAAAMAAAASQSAGEAVEQTPEQMEAILARRARALAAETAVAPSDAFEALVFALGQERYAFPNSQVIEVRPARGITPLSRTPPFVAGLINVRGKVVPVLDPRPLFGVGGADEGGESVILLPSPRGAVGLLTSGSPAVRWLRSTELGALPAGAPAGLDAGYVRGVSPDLIVVLDGERLLADPRIIVQDE